MTPDEIKEALDLHREWLRGEDGGARLSWQDADLRGADFRGAYLRDAYLRGADLRGADFRGAYLRGAYFRGADLRGADIQDAYLRGADLRGADFRGAYLRGADLQDADLQDAYLQGAYSLPHYQICPEEGSFIAWKAARGGIVLKLRIPEDAQRMSSIVGRKCRASHLEVVAAFDVEGNSIDATEFTSKHDSEFTYRIGKVAACENFDPDIRLECTSGLHFWMTRKEAVEWAK